MAVQHMFSSHKPRRLGRLFLLVTLTLLSAGCASWVSTEAYPEVQRRITSGFLAPGDHVRLKTASGEHEFRVTAVDLEQGVVVGGEEVVNIREIVAMEKREPDMTKTIVLAAVIGAAVLLTVVDECSFYCLDFGP